MEFREWVELMLTTGQILIVAGTLSTWWQEHNR